MIDYKYVLPFQINERLDAPIIAKQHDARSRYLHVQLLDYNRTPYNLTGTKILFNAKKRSGQYIRNYADILDAGAGLIAIELTDQTLAEGDANVKADITIEEDNGRTILTTRTFDIWVESTARNDAAILSSNEYGIFVTLTQDVLDVKDTIFSMDKRIGYSGDSRQNSLYGLNEFIAQYIIDQADVAIADMVTQTLARVGAANPTTGDRTTIMNYLRLMENLGSVKSTQWGIVTPTSAADIVVPISQVNIRKCEIKIYPGALSSNSGTLRAPMIKARTNTSFTVTPLYNDRGTSQDLIFYSFSWDVIEMY